MKPVKEALAAIWGGPHQAALRPISEIFAEAKEHGIHVADNGEDISDLVPKAETTDEVYARFNGRKKPAPEAEEAPKALDTDAIWASWNKRKAQGIAA